MSLRLKLLPILALGCLLVLVDVSVAQPPGGGGGRGRGGGMMFGRGGGGAMGLLGNKQVQEELQLVDDQIEEMDALQSELREEMRSMFEGMREMDRDERRAFFEDMREKMAEKTKQYEERYNAILLPHQQQRLKQLQVQTGNRRGLENNETLIDELGLTEEQIEKMKAKAVDVNKKLQEKIAKLRSQAQNEILSVLSPEQQKKYKELAGDSFNLEPRAPQRRGGGGGQRGGRRSGSDF